MPEIRFDTYYRYDELTTILKNLAADYTNLIRLASAGKAMKGVISGWRL